MRYWPARWTSLAASDVFVIAAAGRAYFRLEDLRADNLIHLLGVLEIDRMKAAELN